LVHRFLTYLSRVFKSRLSKKPTKILYGDSLRVFRLATMFYAPVNLSARSTGCFNTCAHTRELYKFVMPDSLRHPVIFPDVGLRLNNEVDSL
jgi:hypothetical protein